MEAAEEVAVTARSSAGPRGDRLVEADRAEVVSSEASLGDPSTPRRPRWGAATLRARGPDRQRASNGTVALAPTIEAPHREDAVGLHVVARQAVEAQSHQRRGNKAHWLRQGAAAPASSAAHLVETVGVRSLESAGGVCCQRAVAGGGDVLGRVVEARVGAPGSCREFPGLASATPVMAWASLAPTRLRDCLAVPGRRWEGRLGVGVILRVAEGDPTVAAVAEEAVSEEARRPDSEGPWRRELLLRLIRPGAARWRTILHPGRERRLERKGGRRDLGGHRRGAGGRWGRQGRILG